AELRPLCRDEDGRPAVRAGTQADSPETAGGGGTIVVVEARAGNRGPARRAVAGAARRCLGLEEKRLRRPGGPHADAVVARRRRIAEVVERDGCPAPPPPRQAVAVTGEVGEREAARPRACRHAADERRRAARRLHRPDVAGGTAGA